MSIDILNREVYTVPRYLTSQLLFARLSTMASRRIQGGLIREKKI